MKPEDAAKHHQFAVSSTAAIVVVIVVVVVGASLSYFLSLGGPGSPTTSTSTSSQSTVQGIIAGIVTVGPSQPVCSPNQSCNVDLTGYSLVFSPQCGGCQRQNFTASIAPSGHYSILLAPGNYSIVGLSPSCKWTGCSFSFPKSVVVVGGQQLVVNIDVDTGIR